MNIFLEGSETERKCKHVIYNLLMTRDWVTHANIIATCMDKPKDSYDSVKLSAIDNKLAKNYKTKISQNIKLMFSALDKICPDCIESNGKSKGVAYRYRGEIENPLADKINEAALKEFENYWQFCQDSAGLLPIAWLEHFFKNTRNLFNIRERKNRGEQIIKVSSNRFLKNIDLLPKLYEAITQKRVVRFEYKPYNEEIKEHVLHPQFLYEFDGRWQVLGYEEDSQYDPAIYSLDRICDGFWYDDNVCYVSRENGYYDKYLENTIGSTHLQNTPIRIRIRAHSEIMFGLTVTKKIHENQEIVVPFGEHEDGIYGEVEIIVCPNNEFYGRILKMGDGLEIVSPQSIRDEIKERIDKMVRLYE